MVSKPHNINCVLDSLKYLGIPAVSTGRNDIVLESKEKISGTAFKYSARRYLHHGAVLVDVDLDVLGSVLTPPKKKIESKGTASVRSRVKNCSAVSPDCTIESLSSSIFNHWKSMVGAEDVPMINIDSYDHPDLVSHTQHFESHDFIWGTTPKFTHELETRFDFGHFRFLISSRHNVINSVKVYSDTLYPNVVDVLEESLSNIQYSPKSVSEALSKISFPPRNIPRPQGT